MELWQAILLGCVQGLSEFLPISSSGHLVVLGQLMSIAREDVVFDVAVHVGTLAAILTIYRQKFFNLARCFFKSSEGAQGRRWLILLVWACLPAVVVALLFRESIEALFGNLVSTGVGFLVTGALIVWSAYRKGSFAPGRTGELDWFVALMIGVAQAVAMVPGVSRSGSTIAVALLLGVGREQAAFFSFSLAVPVILGAAVLQFLSVPDWSAQNVSALVAGVLAAYVLGLVGLKCVVSLVSRARWQIFAWYLGPLGMACIAWALLR